MNKLTLSKADLIEALYEKHPNLTKKAITELINSILATMIDTLAKKGEVNLTGFGKFRTMQRAARTGRNPATGEPIKIAASVSPKFTAGKLLKEAVNVKPRSSKKK